jgi:uncharacterized RDD family membrane protein YckC
MTDQYPTSSEPNEPVPGYTPPSEPGSYQAPAGGYSEPPAADPYGTPAGSYPPPPAPSFPGGFAPVPTGPVGGALAEWPTRALGGLIDYVAPSIVFGILGSVLSNVNSTMGSAVQFVLAIGWWVYLGYLVGNYGVTPGKAIAKIKVVSETTGDVIGVGPAVARQFAHIIDSIICYVGWLFPLWDAKKQTLADKILKTVAIDNSADPNAGQIRWS